MIYNELKKIIEENRNNGVDFGCVDCQHTMNAEDIERTERELKVKLPPSYLWFLENYGGGEIYGEEIFSVYSINNKLSSGDLSYITIYLRAKGAIRNSDIVICTNDFGEYFVMDTSQQDRSGEYSVYVQRGEYRQKYAESFADFLFKKIENVSK